MQFSAARLRSLVSANMRTRKRNSAEIAV